MDMYDYNSNFPIHALPHINESNEIIDNVHNYPKAHKNMR
jgi:hypothetical protein